jgi:hypothetical protein
MAEQAHEQRRNSETLSTNFRESSFDNRLNAHCSEQTHHSFDSLLALLSEGMSKPESINGS